MRAIAAAQAKAFQKDRSADVAGNESDVNAMRERLVVLQQQKRFAEADTRRRCIARGWETSENYELGLVFTRISELEHLFGQFSSQLSSLARGLEDIDVLKHGLSDLNGKLLNEQHSRLDQLNKRVGVLESQDQQKLTGYVNQLDRRLSILEGDRAPLDRSIKDLQDHFGGFVLNVEKMQTDVHQISAALEQMVSSSAATKDSAVIKPIVPDTPPKNASKRIRKTRIAHGEGKDTDTSCAAVAQLEPRDQSKIVSEPDNSQQRVARDHSDVDANKVFPCSDADKDKFENMPIADIAGDTLADAMQSPEHITHKEQVPMQYTFLPQRMVGKKNGFTMISMNILAGYLGRNKTHGHCSESNLVWEARRSKLLEGFKRARPDLLLLQEVQGTAVDSKDNHAELLNRDLDEVGYAMGAYVRTCGADGIEEGTSSSSKSKKKPHIGNAVFYQKESWNQLDHGRIAFAQVLTEQVGENIPQLKHYAEGKQVAVWTRLRHVVSQRTIVAVSVHISNSYSQPDKQLAQVNAMLHHLESKVLQEGDALVIGGDFNSLPSSGVYKLLSTSAIEAEHPDTVPSSQAVAAGVTSLCGSEGYRTGIKLASAYASLNGAEPAFTTKDPNFAGAIDYIWYLQGNLSPEQSSALCMPTDAEGGAEGGGLPNSRIPSDHVPLGLGFEFSFCDEV